MGLEIQCSLVEPCKGRGSLLDSTVHRLFARGSFHAEWIGARRRRRAPWRREDDRCASFSSWDQREGWRLDEGPIVRGAQNLEGELVNDRARVSHLDLARRSTAR